MPFAGFSQNATLFLAELSRNNERAWFEAHRDGCDRFVIEPAKALVEALGVRLRELDPKIQAIPRVRGSIKAMERPRRFPNSGRPPYKDSLDLLFWSGRRRAWDNSGFYLRLAPARLTLAAGMIEFQKEALSRYRLSVLDDTRGAALSSVVRDLESGGYAVVGEGYKRTPPGVPADHPRASLLKHRGLFANLDGEHPSELHTSAFVDFCFSHFARMSKLHAWLVDMQTGR
jgi:uncharacterized protein (TIGR02453 family)